MMLFKRKSTAPANRHDDLSTQNNNDNNKKNISDSHKKRKISGIFRRGNSAKSETIESALTWTLSEDNDDNSSSEMTIGGGTSNNNIGPQQPAQPLTQQVLLQDTFLFFDEQQEQPFCEEEDEEEDEDVKEDVQEVKESEVQQSPSSPPSQEQEQEETLSFTRKELEERELKHIHELSQREETIRRLVEVNQNIIAKHQKGVRSLTRVFKKKLEKKDMDMKIMEFKYGLELRVCNRALKNQEKELVKANMELKQLDDNLSRTFKRMRAMERRHSTEIEVFDHVALSQEEDLMQVQSELDVTTVHLKRASSLLIESHATNK